jgi:hypothetical protein
MIELEGEPRSRRVLETLEVEAGYLISGMIPLINLGWLGGDRDSDGIRDLRASRTRIDGGILYV